MLGDSKNPFEHSSKVQCVNSVGLVRCLNPPSPLVGIKSCNDVSVVKLCCVHQSYLAVTVLPLQVEHFIYNNLVYHVSVQDVICCHHHHHAFHTLTCKNQHHICFWVGGTMESSCLIEAFFAPYIGCYHSTGFRKSSTQTLHFRRGLANPSQNCCKF